MKLRKLIALRAMLLGAMAVPMLMAAAYAQQEVDPTWYDPWAASHVVAKTAPAKPAEHQDNKNVQSANVVQKAHEQAAKVRAHKPHPAPATVATLGTK